MVSTGTFRDRPSLGRTKRARGGGGRDGAANENDRSTDVFDVKLVLCLTTGKYRNRKRPHHDKIMIVGCDANYKTHVFVHVSEVRSCFFKEADLTPDRRAAVYTALL